MSLYRIGVKSESTRELQRLLLKAGFLSSSVFDGIYSEDLQNAVNIARAALQLPPSGRVDEDFLTRLAARAAGRQTFPSAKGSGAPAGQPAGAEPAPAARPTLSTWLTGLAIKQAVTALKGTPMLSFLDGSKTYIIGGLGLIVGVASMFIQIPGVSGDSMQIILQSLAVLGLRRALKSGN